MLDLKLTAPAMLLDLAPMAAAVLLPLAPLVNILPDPGKSSLAMPHHSLTVVYNSSGFVRSMNRATNVGHRCQRSQCFPILNHQHDLPLDGMCLLDESSLD